jgi:hypothetical protein
LRIEKARFSLGDECLKRGLKDDEYFIGMVAPHDETEMDNTRREFDE